MLKMAVNIMEVVPAVLQSPHWIMSMVFILLWCWFNDGPPSVTPPSKHKTLNKCWFYCWPSVADGGTTLNQHWLHLLCLLGRPMSLTWWDRLTPIKQRHWTHGGSMLCRRRRRRSNIDPTLGQCLDFNGLWDYYLLPRRCLFKLPARQ